MQQTKKKVALPAMVTGVLALSMATPALADNDNTVEPERAPDAQYCTAEGVSITSSDPQGRVFTPDSEEYPAINSLSYRIINPDTGEEMSAYQRLSGDVRAGASYSQGLIPNAKNRWNFEIKIPDGVEAGQKTAIHFSTPWTTGVLPAEGLSWNGVKLADLSLADADSRGAKHTLIITFNENAAKYKDIVAHLSLPMSYSVARDNKAATYKGVLTDCGGNVINSATIESQDAKFQPTGPSSWVGTVGTDENDYKFESFNIAFRNQKLTCEGTGTWTVTPDPELVLDPEQMFTGAYAMDSEGDPTRWNADEVLEWEQAGDSYTATVKVGANTAPTLFGVFAGKDGSNKPEYTVNATYQDSCGYKYDRTFTASKPSASSSITGKLPANVVATKKATGALTYELSVTNDGEMDATDVSYDDVMTLAGEEYPGNWTIEKVSAGTVEGHTWKIGTLKGGQTVTATVVADPGDNLIAGDVINTLKPTQLKDCSEAPEKCINVGHGSAIVDKELIEEGSFADKKPAHYKLTVTNPSETYTATGVYLTEKPDAGLDAETLEWVKVDRGETDGNKWIIGDLEPGESVTAEITVAVTEDFAKADENSVASRNITTVTNDQGREIPDCTDDAKELQLCDVVETPGKPGEPTPPPTTTPTPDKPASPNPGSLPHTGANNVGILAALGLTLLGAGTGVTWYAKRRRNAVE